MNITEKIEKYLDEDGPKYEDVWTITRERHLKKVEQTDKDYHDKKITKEEWHTQVKKHGEEFHKDLDDSTSPARKNVIATHKLGILDEPVTIKNKG